jgi:organic radical activating enzyme
MEPHILQPPIAPSILALHLTYRCPLQCPHCCVDAGPTKRVELHADQIRALIRQAADDCNIQGIGVTGGDPFLLPHLVALALTEAKSRALRTHVVTSGYWATSLAEAVDRLHTVTRDAGLDELCISYDDSHAKYVPFKRIEFAYQAAMLTSIPVKFLVTLDPASVITPAWLHARLEQLEHYNADITAIACGSVVSTGRSATTTTNAARAARQATDAKYLGPCPIVFRRLAVNPDGNILACCGTVPFHRDLCIGNVTTHTLSEAVTQMYHSPLLKWIAFEGPVQVLKTITETDPQPLTEKDFEGICQACDVLFANPTLSRRAHAAALTQQADRLALEELIFRTLGHFPQFVPVTTTHSASH